jgi:hypothetical protein
MPAVGDLECIGDPISGGLSITTAAIARDDADVRMRCQPSCHSAGVPVWKEVDDAASFEIADKRPVSLTALPGPVIDPDNMKRRFIAASVPTDCSQQSIPADRQHKTPCKTCSWTTAEGDAATMNDAIFSRPSCQDKVCNRTDFRT